MRLKTFFSALFIMMAGLQTAWAQKMIVRSGSSSGGYYWSSSLSQSDDGNGCYLHFGSGLWDWSYFGRCNGLPVRPVCP